MPYPTNAQLAGRLRIDAADPALPGIAAAVQAYIDNLSFRDLPEAVRNEAYTRFAGYLFDAPEAAGGASYANGWRNSGAQALVAPWRVQRAAVIGAAGQSASPAPAPAPGGPGVDETARAGVAQNAEDITAERAAREAAVAAEAQARQDADTALGKRIDGLTPAQGGVVDQTARDQAETNRVEIARNSSAVVTARQEAAAAKRAADAAQEAIPAKASQADIDDETDDDDFTTTAKVFRAIARKVKNASTTIRGIVLLARNEDVDASETDTSRVLTVASAKRLIARIGTGRSDSALEAFIERILSPWAVAGTADDIPGSKTFDGLFKSEQQTALPAANATIAFDVGNANDEDVVDETDAEDTSFAISSEQAAEADAFIRVRYKIGGAQVKHRPTDVELLLQVRDSGEVIGKHNLPLDLSETEGTAQFPVGDAGAKRWAVRIVTAGSYKGEVRITEAEYHSSQSLADPPIEHVVHPIVSREAEERQAEDKRLTAEIARVEGIKAIVNGLPAATPTRKGNIAWRTDKEYQQTDDDAFQVPATGFVQFILGNIGATGIMRAEDCHNRKQIVYAQGNHEIALNFSAERKAVITAQNTRSNKRSTLFQDIVPNLPSPGLVMLVWATARQSGHAETELAELETRVEKLEEAGGGEELTPRLLLDFRNASNANFLPVDLRKLYGPARTVKKVWILIEPGPGTGQPSFSEHDWTGLVTALGVTAGLPDAAIYPTVVAGPQTHARFKIPTTYNDVPATGHPQTFHLGWEQGIPSVAFSRVRVWGLE